MRVRITKSIFGSIDGIQLDRFICGLTYDVGTTLGNYLLAEEWAVPVESHAPALVVPLDAVAEVLSFVNRPTISEVEEKTRRRVRKQRSH